MSNEVEKIYNKALEAEEKGNNIKALTLYKEVLKLNSSDPRYHIGLGVCLMKLNHGVEAAKSLKKGIDLKPSYAEADARLFLAEALYNAGQKKNAIEQLSLVIKMEPVYPSREYPVELLAQWNK